MSRIIVSLWTKIFGCLLIANIAILAQPLTNRLNRPVQAPIRSVVIASNPASQPEPLDPLLAMMMQQANTDTNVVADAEFDPPLIGVGEPTTYRVVVTALSEAVVLPEKLPFPSALTVKVGGHGMAYASSGQAIQYRTTFNFHVTSSATGTYLIPSFVVTGNGRQIAVPSKQLTVLPAGARPVINRPILMAQLPPGEYFIGQSVPIMAVLTDPSTNSAAGLIQPDVIGNSFIVDQSVSRQWREVRNINGVNVSTVIHEMAVIPIKEGQLEVSVQAFVPLQRNPNDGAISLPSYYPLFDSPPIALQVKHLPKQGELPGFTGLVGTFKLNPPTLSSNDIHAGSPVYLSVSVSGHGNVSRLVPPKLDYVPGWQVFSPVSDPNPAQLIQIFGSNVFGYAMIPLSDRIRTTPRIPFSYFDPKQMTYVDLTIPSIPIRVLATGGSGGATNEFENNTNAERTSQKKRTRTRSGSHRRSPRKKPSQHGTAA